MYWIPVPEGKAPTCERSVGSRQQAVSLLALPGDAVMGSDLGIESLAEQGLPVCPGRGQSYTCK